MMGLTLRLLCGPVILMTHLLLLPLPALAVEEGIPSWSSLRGLGNNGGRQSLSRQEELTNALQFLEEYERNLEDDVDEEDEDYEPTWQANRFPFLRGEQDEDEDIVPEELLEMEEPEQENTQFMNVLQNVLQSAYRNRNDVVPQGYRNTQRSAFNSPYELFSPVDADLEDELVLEDAIVKLEFKAKKQRLWEGILKDMLAEEMAENDAQERINELMDVEEEEEEIEDEIVAQDSIFEEDDPWTGLESSSYEALDEDESDTVPWAWPDEEESVFDDDEEEILFADDTDSADMSSDDEAADIEREAAVIILEEILAEDERRREREEEEEEAEEEILEMIAGDESEEDDEDLSNEVYDKETEDIIANYFRKLMEDNSDNDDEYDGNEETLEEVGDDDDESSEIWDDSSAEDLVDMEEFEEAIQEYDDAIDAEEENDYDQLLREITNEIEAAAQEVEEEVVAALQEQLEENNQNNADYYNEDEEEALVVDKKDDSTDADELDAEDFLRLVSSLSDNQQPVEEFTNTEPDTCPIYRWLVDDCAFIEKFPGVDDDGLYRNLFQRACNRHQLCYTCGESYEIEGALCNDVFDAEMLAECGQDEDCTYAAEQFVFVATKTFTRASESPQFCQARCLMQYLVMD